MGLKAEVHFAGHIFKILVFFRRMHQVIDEVNKPIGRPTGHLIDLVLESSTETNEFAAWLIGQQMKELKIVFSPVTGNGKSRTILLRDAYCVFFEEKFESTTAYPMTSLVSISAGIVDDGAVKHFEYWKVSDIIPPKFESKPEIVLTPKISKITWVDTKTQEKTEETTYGNKIALAIKIANHKSGTASIKIEKEDGNEFENGEKSFTYVESVDDDGIAEISEIEIKEQWEEFKTADKDTLIATVEYLGATKKSKPLQLKTFDVKIKLLKDNKTLVPMGIPAFGGAVENKFIEFEIEVIETGIDSFVIELLKDDKVVYTQQSGNMMLDEVVVTGKGSKDKQKNKPKDEGEEAPENYPVGNYSFQWDGFIEGKYDSLLFLEGKFKARIKGSLNKVEKTAETVVFSFESKEVNWVDVKIDENAKRIDIVLRVNLTDGGAKGTEEDCKMIGRSRATQKMFCPWDIIPKKDLISKKNPIKIRTKTFEELKQMTLKGLNKYWSRHQDNIGKNIEVDGIAYEVFVNAEYSTDKSLDDIPLIFNTNNPWSRSGNPGKSELGDGNKMDELAKVLPDGIVQRISYNVGYIKYSNGWGYKNSNKENLEFEQTAAHEIGHEILQAYAGTIYSWQHKGSSYYLPQDKKPVGEESFKEEYINRDYMEETKGENYPKNGEVDLMKYYHNDLEIKKRTVANRNDVLSLIWLTKIELK